MKPSCTILGPGRRPEKVAHVVVRLLAGIARHGVVVGHVVARERLFGRRRIPGYLIDTCYFRSCLIFFFSLLMFFFVLYKPIRVKSGLSHVIARFRGQR